MAPADGTIQPAVCTRLGNYTAPVWLVLALFRNSEAVMEAMGKSGKF